MPIELFVVLIDDGKTLARESDCLTRQSGRLFTNMLYRTLAETYQRIERLSSRLWVIAELVDWFGRMPATAKRIHSIQHI
jgi:hypothetical protein